MTENELSKIIIDACYQIHVGLGPGLFESVYEEVLSFELMERGIAFTRQEVIPLEWKGLRMEQAFRADLIVENKVIVEIKSVEHIAPVHAKQVLTYLRLTGLRLGLLINFNAALLKHGVTRLVNKL